MDKKRIVNIITINLALITLVILLLPIKAHAMDQIQGVLVDAKVGHQIRVVWNALLGFANSIMVIALLVIAFANILHIQIDKYAIKKILPSLITAIVLANFSYFICRFFIDIANMLLSFVLTSSGGADKSISSRLLFADVAIPKPDTGASGTFYPLFWAAFFSYLGTIVGSVFMAILAYLFFIRNWVLYFLIALSPLGFIGLALPQTQTLFQTWWKQFLQWLFMPVVASFWLWVGAQFLKALEGSVGGTMMFVFAIACFYMAFTTPFKMGGAIMKGWGGFGKKLMSPVTGAGAAGGGFIKNRWVNPLIKDYGKRIQGWYGKRVLGDVVRHEKDDPSGRWKKGDPIHGKPILGKDGEHQEDSEGNLMYEHVRTRKKPLDRILGWHYDRSKTMSIDRADREKRWESIQDQMQGNTMNYWSQDKKRKRSAFIDESNSYLGEIERSELDQRLDFLSNTADGHIAALRTKFYNDHMAAMKSRMAQIDKNLESEIVKGGDGVLTDSENRTIYSGNGFWRRSGVQSEKDRVAAGVYLTDKAANKIVFDDARNQYATAGKVNMIIDLLKSLSQTEEAIKRLDMTDGRNQEKLREVQEEAGQWHKTLGSLLTAHAVGEINPNDGSFMGEYGKEGEARLSPLVKQIIGKMASYDSSGQVILEGEGENRHVKLNTDAASVASIKTIGETAGFEYDSPEDRMTTDRGGKAMTETHIGEKTAEKAKRLALESAAQFAKPRLRKALVKSYAGQELSESEWAMMDMEGRLGNLHDGAATHDNSEATEAYSKLRDITAVDIVASPEATRTIVNGDFEVLSRTLSSIAKGTSFKTQMKTAYTGAGTAHPIVINGTTHQITDENSFVSARKAAEAARDTASMETLDDIQAEAIQTLQTNLLDAAGIDPNSLSGAANMQMKIDADGHLDDVELSAAENYESDIETRKKVEHFRHNAMVKLSKQSSRLEPNKAFLNALDTVLNPYKEQYHNRAEKKIKAAKDRAKAILES